MNQSTARRPEPLDALREWGGPAQMSAFEASMWLAEADPRLRTTVTGVMVLDRAPDWQRLVDGHQRMVNAVVRLRQRVLEPALGLGLPQWVDDPDFQLQYHLRRQTLAAPGTQRQLLDMAQIFAMTPFDRSRPPWEGMVVEGLENGRAAYVLKLHHVLSDGIGLTQLFAHAVSQQRESRGLPVGAAPRRADAAQSALELAAHNARQRVRELPGSTLGALAHSLEVASTFLRRPDATQEIRDYLHSAGRIVATRPVAGSPILRRRSRAWRFDPIELPFAGLKTAAHTLEASINDVFLAGLLGGLRRYHDEMGVQIDQMPIAFPISLRKQGDAAGGNHFAGAQYAA
ncbi:MAG: wax ester/triacylglycerol synthase domain-containing protein, partial [Rhodoferax sp.]